MQGLGRPPRPSPRPAFQYRGVARSLWVARFPVDRRLVIVLVEVVTVAKRRFQVRVTYVVSRTYRVVAVDEDAAVDAAMGRTPRFLDGAEADVTEVTAL